MKFTDEEIARYARHLVLREIGGPGQQALKASRVLMIGAGGLGSPCALYLAAAGVGVLGLVDADTVGLSNLQRQILFTGADVGRKKVAAGAERLLALNDTIEIEAAPFAVDTDNIAGLVGRYDLIVDGTDDFAVRLLVSDACVAAGKTLVSGAIGRWSGQVGVFAGRPCYRCLVPDVPPDAETCALVGVVGALAGVVGSMMALETIKLIAGAGRPLSARLLVYDALAGETRTLDLAADPACPACGAGPA